MIWGRAWWWGILCLAVVATVIGTYTVRRAVHRGDRDPPIVNFDSATNSDRQITNSMTSPQPAAQYHGPDADLASDKLLANIVATDLTDIMKRADTELSFASLSPEAQAEYSSALRALAANGDIAAGNRLVDTSCQVMQECWWTKNPSFAYRLCQRSREHLDALTQVVDGTTLSLAEHRLLVWKFRIERVWGGLLREIPHPDAAGGKRAYEALKDIQPQTPLQSYQKCRLLVEGQSAFLGTLTDLSPVAAMVQAPPLVEQPWEKVAVAQNHVWALLKTADFVSPANHPERWKSKLQQYEEARQRVQTYSTDLGPTLGRTDKLIFEGFLQEALQGVAECNKHLTTP